MREGARVGAKSCVQNLPTALVLIMNYEGNNNRNNGDTFRLISECHEISETAVHVRSTKSSHDSSSEKSNKYTLSNNCIIFTLDLLTASFS